MILTRRAVSSGSDLFTKVSVFVYMDERVNGAYIRGLSQKKMYHYENMPIQIY